MKDKMKAQTFVKVHHRFGGIRDKNLNRDGMWDYRDFKGG